MNIFFSATIQPGIICEFSPLKGRAPLLRRQLRDLPRRLAGRVDRTEEDALRARLPLRVSRAMVLGLERLSDVPLRSDVTMVHYHHFVQ